MSPLSESRTQSSTRRTDIENAGMDDDSLSAARIELCEHIQSLPEISNSEFMGYYMPPSPVDVDLLVDKLAQRSQVLVRQKGFTPHPTPLLSSTVPKWAAFIESPQARATSGGYRKDVFADLESITAQIVECCRDIAPHLQPAYQLRSNGTRTLYGHVYTYAQPDGSRVLVSMKPSGGFEALSEGYEPKLCNAVDDYQKIVWNMHQTMRSDYTRRFVFGVTIHNTSVRLWHMNRELMIVSNSFNMYEDYRTFADMHARFAFASQDELGYDHTMTKLYPNLPKDERYRVKVGGEYYITTQVLENYAAEDNFGRCTRIFCAYKEDDDSRDAKYAIKDGWLGRESQLEVDVYNAIMAGIDAHDWSQYSAPPKDVYDFAENVKKWEELPPLDFKHGTNVDRKRFFMPIKAGERVKVQDGRDDDTRAVIARGYSVPSHPRQFSSLTKVSTKVNSPAASKVARARTSQRDGVEGDKKKAAESSTTPGICAQSTAPRVHHRSVMLLAIPLDKIQSVKQAFSTLSDATYGLFILHCLEYCHRDVSPYNIFSLNGHGVLGDFEHTTHAASTAQLSRMTGTPNFMAVEVMTGTFMVDRHTANDSDFIEAIFARRHLNSMPEDVWEYSSVHDLESIWWIALWLLFRHTLQLPFLVPPYDVEAHEIKYRELFPGRVIAQSRFDHLKDARTLVKTLSVLPPVYTDTVTAPLYLIRNYLMRYYQRQDVNSPPHPLMWWMIGYLLCQSRGQQIGGDFVSFTFPQRAGSFKAPPENEIDHCDEDDDTVAKVSPPCPSHRSGLVLSPQHEVAHSDEEGNKRLHIGVSVIAKRRFLEADGETLKEDGDSDRKEAHRADKKRRQAEL